MLSYPDRNGTPKHVPIEPEEKWYPEEERENLIKKYEHLETIFERLVFEQRFEEISVQVQVINKLQTPVSVSRSIIETEAEITSIVKLNPIAKELKGES